MTFSAVTLSLLYWMKKRNQERLNTFFFVGYLAVLFILAGVRFYWEGLLEGGPIVSLGTRLAESLGYSLLLFYLPSVINHMLGHRWTPIRLAASIVACVVYFILDGLTLLPGFHMSIAIVAVLIFFAALTVILVNAARNIPRIVKPSARITVTVVTLLTVIFLPLVLAGKLMIEVEGPWIVAPDLRFFFLSLYYFWMALAGNVYYIRELSTSPSINIDSPDIPVDLPLTDREKDVATALVCGLTYGEIAEDLDISPHTVRNHVSNIYKKLAIHSKMELVGVFHRLQQ